MLQTLFFKFSGAAESVALFQMLNILNLPESYARFGVGGIELLASLLLFHKKTEAIGSIFAIGLMSGAIMLHLTILGIAGQQGILFGMALTVATCAAFINLRAAYSSVTPEEEIEEKAATGGW
jgi:hypothetical protein